MGFSEQLRKESSKIYTFLLHIIKEDMEDDIKYYDEVIFNDIDGYQITYKINNKEFTIKRKDEYAIRITKDDMNIFSDDCHNKYSYDTSLDKKVNDPEWANSEWIKHDYEYQNMLSKETKDYIFNALTKVNDVIDGATINYDATEDVDNFNWTLLDIYSKYIYVKAKEYLKANNKTVLPSVEAAVNWWVETLSAPPTKHTGDALTDIFGTAITPDSSENEDMELFKKTLSKLIMDDLYEYNGDIIKIDNDYGPGYLLCDAMKEANINFMKAPWKMGMIISPSTVWVREGYGSGDKKIYEDSLDQEEKDYLKKLYDNYFDGLRVVNSRTGFQRDLNKMVDKKINKKV